jgi:restriction system protein
VVYGITQGVGGNNVQEMASSILRSALIWGGGALALLIGLQILISPTGRAHASQLIQRLASRLGGNRPKEYQNTPWVYKRGDPATGANVSSVNDPALKDAPEAVEALRKEPPCPQWSLDLLQSLAWQRLEKLTAEILNVKYQAVLTGTGADGGVDLRLYQKSDESRQRPIALVQVKSRSRQKVGVAIARELKGVMSVEKVPNGVLVGTSGFTDDAIAFAGISKIQLIDGEKILKMVSALLPEKQQSLLSELTAGDHTIPDCPSCGVALVRRTTKKGQNRGRQFWGCTNYPRCKFTLNG